MNTLVFDVYKNTIKKTDGFNPVNAEKSYTNLLFKFKKGDDWEKCGAVTLSFFESSDDITHSQVDIKEGSLTATFRLPNAYKSLFLGITGVYIDDEGESVTVATNIIKINLIKGVIVTDSVNMDVYEKLMSYFATVRKSDLPMVDIRNFGAVPDNPSVDNAEAIKQAIEFASLMRGRVYIPPATFYVNSTIPIRNKENLTIINDGIIYAKSKELKDNKFSVLFSCYQCKNLNFTAGTIKSDRDKIGKAPLNHTRENLNDSNIIGVHINDCEDVIIENYTSIGLESALVIDAADGVVSKNIVLKQLKSFETSQPVYGSHFEKFTITDIYCEECPGCGLGDHFIYISSNAKDFTINSGRLVYTDCKYGVAINLRYAGSSADVNNGMLPDEYDASDDLNSAYISNLTVDNCVQFVSAKAKTKVTIEGCIVNDLIVTGENCIFLSEYAEIYVKNSKFVLKNSNPLLSISNNASHNVTFSNCNIRTGLLFNIGSNTSTDKEVFNKNIAFLNCDIVCNASTSPIWLNCASEINVSFVNSKLTTNRFYVFYIGNDNIRFSIIGTEFLIDESANGLRLIYTPYDIDNTSGYSPADNVQVINSVCRNIKKICSSQNIVDYNNLIFDKEGNVTSNSGTVGKDGEDGYSPTATVTQTDAGAIITITDEKGTTMASVTNGVDGKDGANGTKGKDGVPCTHSWNGTTLTVTSASGTSSVNLKGDKGDTGAKGADGSDYILTNSDKSEIATAIKTDLAQLEPLFANSIEECTDISKVYVLPDGYIYAYMATATEGGTVPTFTNLMNDPNAYIKEGYRYSHSSATFKECSTDCVVVVPIPSTAGAFTVRIKAATISGAQYPTSAYFGTNNQTFEGTNDITNVEIKDDNNGTVMFTQKVYDGSYNYMVIHVANKIDKDNLIVTLNEEISYTTIESSVVYKWTNTGHAFVPADYEDRIVAAETKLNEHDTKFDNLKLNSGVGLSLEHNSCSIFRKVVCCGDSFTAGYIGTNETNISQTNYDYAWPSFMARLTGNEYVNCGHSGKDVITWQTSAKGLPRAQAAGKAQAYLIGLGLNDVSLVTLGTIEDIGTENQTYYGGLSKIIRELNAISPTAKIFVQTMPSDYVLHVQYNEAIRNVVNAYKNTYPVHLLDLYNYKSLYKIAKIEGDSILGHYTAIGYQQFAENLRYVWSEYINNNISEFQDAYLIPYDETNL